MSPRQVGWIAGLALGTTAAVALPDATGELSMRFVGFVAGLLACGLAGEMVAVGLAPKAPAPPPAVDDRPADGVVGRVEVRGARSEPNRNDPAIGRFLGLDASGNDRRSTDSARARPLLGRVAIVSLFVGRDGRAWSDAEVVEAHKSLRRAGEWVEREAIRWAAPINIDLAATYFAAEDEAAEDVEIGLYDGGDAFEANAVPKAIASASRAAASLGFADVGDLVERVGPRIEADVRVWLLHLRRAGRSMAAAEDDSGLPGVNLAVCYAREENFPEPLAGPPYCDPITVVHELLHLFGARDKYDVPLRSFPAKSVTERDVMRLDTESLSRLRVDLLTATEIGWAKPGQAPPAETADARRASGRGGRRG